jgi:hypothetical protein
MGIKEMLEGWVLKVALKKGVKAAGAVILSAVASVKIAPVLSQLGVTVDPAQLEVGLTAFGTAAVTMGLNWLKMKTPLGKKLL